MTRTCSMMGDSFSKHGFPTAWGSKHENTSWRVNSNLFIQLKVCEGQLHCLSHFLFLDVHSTNIGVGNFGLLIYKNKFYINSQRILFLALQIHRTQFFHIVYKNSFFHVVMVEGHFHIRIDTCQYVSATCR